MGTVKRAIDTRWCARGDAVKAVKTHFVELRRVLEKLVENGENVNTRAQAATLHQAVSTLPFLSFLGMWSQVLPEINEAHLYLQTAGLNVHQSELRIGSLKLWLERHRDRIMDEAMTYSRDICQDLEIEPPPSRTRSENSEVISLEQSLRLDMHESIDRIVQEMKKRFEALHSLVQRFGVLVPSNFFEERFVFSPEDHSVDIDVTEFLIERKRLDSFVCVVDSKVKNDLMQGGPLQLLKFILEWDLATSVPNVMILLRIFLTMGAS